MRYVGNIFRPPSEAYSLILQVTIGCAHNACTFCSMFKDKRFRVRNPDEVMEDLEDARRRYSAVDRIFLADGDALVLSDERLIAILRKINELFPECRRIGVYGSPQDVLKKGVSRLKNLKDEGLGIVYIGGESGSDKVLADIKKGVTSEQIIESVNIIEEAGIPASVTFISGLAGEGGWEDHAISTGNAISRCQPSYASLLTLMVEPAAPIYEDIRSGAFKLLPPAMVIKEARLMLEHMDVKRDCVFRSNHASNYLSLKGTLPGDKERLLGELDAVMDRDDLLKSEYLRAL